MRDLREIYQSSSYKANDFEVELIDEELYKWNVKVKKIDQDSPLAKDMLKLKEKENIDYIQLSILFPFKSSKLGAEEAVKSSRPF